MAIRRNPLSNKKQSPNIRRSSIKPKRGAEAFIGQATDPAEQAAGTEKVNSWEESEPGIVRQHYFQIPLGNNRKFELFWRISREETP